MNYFWSELFESARNFRGNILVPNPVHDKYANQISKRHVTLLVLKKNHVLTNISKTAKNFVVVLVSILKLEN